MSARLGAESGQVIVFVVAILTVLIGISALVIDGGHWFHTQRHLQTAADAAALAGVQNLPSSPSTATSVANTYAQDNYSGAGTVVTFPSTPSPCGTNSCIRVVANKTAPGTLARIYGAVFDNVNVSAKAMAAVTVPSTFKNVAPVAVKNTVACTTDPTCFGRSQTVGFNESSVASSTIGLINLTCHNSSLPACVNNNNVGATELKDWIINGFVDALPSGQWYGVKTGQNVGPIKQGFDARIGVMLFFPVFDTTQNIGSVWYFHIVGWSAFVIDSVVSWSPSDKRLRGHFVTYTPHDLPAGIPPTSGNDFGVHILTLVE